MQVKSFQFTLTPETIQNWLRWYHHMSWAPLQLKLDVLKEQNATKRKDTEFPGYYVALDVWCMPSMICLDMQSRTLLKNIAFHLPQLFVPGGSGPKTDKDQETASAVTRLRNHGLTGNFGVIASKIATIV